MRVGVLALQGAFREHIVILGALGVEADAIRKPEQLAACSGLIVPGGESTAIAKLMKAYDFYDPIIQHYGAGLAVWGTCAGAILLASGIIDAVEGQRGLELMNIVVRRNAFGRQAASFEADLDIADLAGGAFRGVFIRAPWIESVGKSARVLATHDGHVVAARQDSLLATVFHPELTGDVRMHAYFVEEVIGSARR
ncbi:MAG: pyridoxal 5'-phosphate synthase glutaminase subunit PdxT [Clostridiales bacterium]|nr:pyridoxal 5'-phosphate synthase glutaminase subunit PdxT [Clostridiales bacterium]